MKHLIEQAPGVADSFFNLTASIREHCTLTPRERELVLLGVLTANRAPRGIVTHVERAIESGASKDEIISAITLALPVSGIVSVNEALNIAIETIEVDQKKSAV